MTDWARDMAEKLKRINQSQELRDAKFLELQRVKRELGPKIWSALKSDISAESISLNREIGREIITTDKNSSADEVILVGNIDGRIRRSYVQFEVESGKLTYKTERGFSDNFELYVGPDGKIEFYSGMIPYRTVSIARQILEKLLESDI